MDLALHASGAHPAYLDSLLSALESLPEAETAPDGSVVFCPDATALAPPPAAAGLALVAAVPDAAALHDPARRPELGRTLGLWAERGAQFIVCTSTGAGTLQALLGLPPGRTSVVPFPLPVATVPGAAAGGGTDILVTGALNLDVLLSAVALLRVAGLTPRLLLSGQDAEPVVRPGGRGAAYGLLPGTEVLAVAAPSDATAEAGVIVVGDGDYGLGWTLRAALATGRPVVAMANPWTRDHLGAIGADAYQYSSLSTLVSALAAALRGHRSPQLEDAARAAVLRESWEAAAREVLAVLVDSVTPDAAASPTPLPAPRVHAEVAHDALRVCVVNPNANGGGGERFMRQLVLSMAAHHSRPSVQLLCGVRPGAMFDAGSDALARAGVGTRIIPHADVHAALDEETAASDVIYYSWPHASDPPALAVPLACTIHDINWKHFDIYPPEELAMIERQVPAWIAHSAAVIHSSKFIRDEVLEYYGGPPERAHFIPAAADPPPIAPTDEQRHAVRRRFGLPERFLLSPHGAHRNKNYPALECALRLLRADGRPVPVIATGMATEAFHGPDLIGLGYVSSDEVHALYAESSGIVQTTLYEAGSFPLFESMSFGKPVAISRIPPITEQLARVGAAAELFDPVEPEDVADAIWRLWTGSPMTAADTLARNARAVASRTWDDVAGDYLRLFGQLAAACSARPARDLRPAGV